MSRRHGWALALARRYARWSLSRAFEGVYVDGLDEVRAAAARGPLLLCANHLSWWDAFAVVAVDEALGTDGVCVMDEANLARLPFFGAIGGMPLSLTAPRRALKQLKDVASRLDRPGRAAWIFPQGHHVPSWRRPLGFRRGFGRIVDESGCAVVPVSILISFRERREPALLVRLSSPRVFAAGDRDLARVVEGAVEAGLDSLDHAVAHDALPPVLVPGSERAATTTTATRLLARLAGAP